MKKFLVIGCLILLSCTVTKAEFLTSYGIGNTNTTYNRGQIGRQGQVSIGKILAMTPIDVAGTNSTGGLVGAGVGGALGGVGGSTIGGGKGSILMTIGGATIGALAGAALGSATEEKLTQDKAYEFLVQMGSSDTVISIVQTNELKLRPGDNVVLVEIAGTTRIRQKY